MIEENVINFRRHLQMFPFNEHLSNEDKTNHRTFMIEKTNFSIFLYGQVVKKAECLKNIKLQKIILIELLYLLVVLVEQQE